MSMYQTQVRRSVVSFGTKRRQPVVDCHALKKRPLLYQRAKLALAETCSCWMNGFSAEGRWFLHPWKSKARHNVTRVPTTAYTDTFTFSRFVFGEVCVDAVCSVGAAKGLVPIGSFMSVGRSPSLL